MLVAVNTFYIYGRPVYHQLGILYFYLPESGLAGRHRRIPLPVPQGQDAVVKFGSLGCPFGHILDSPRKGECFRLPLHLELPLLCPYDLTGLIHQFHLYLAFSGFTVCKCTQIHRGIENAVPVTVVQTGMQEKVPHRQLGVSLQVHVALNARQTPEILVFHVTAVMPTVHPDGQQVLPFAKVRRHVELSRCLGRLGHPDPFPVQENLCITGYGPEMQQDFAAVPAFRHGEHLTVRPHRIIHVHVRRVGRKNILDIADNRFAEPFQLPIRRDVQIDPRGIIEIFLIKALFRVLDVRRVRELPPPVQGFIPR